jgi:hypothetical protein
MGKQSRIIIFYGCHRTRQRPDDLGLCLRLKTSTSTVWKGFFILFFFLFFFLKRLKAIGLKKGPNTPHPSIQCTKSGGSHFFHFFFSPFFDFYFGKKEFSKELFSNLRQSFSL